MNKSLCQNQSEWQTKVEKSQKEMEVAQAKKDKEIQELQVSYSILITILGGLLDFTSLKDFKQLLFFNDQEQVRDLMFYVEAQQKIAASPLGQEMKDGDLVMPESNLGSGESASRTTPKSGKSSLGAKSKRKGR